MDAKCAGSPRADHAASRARVHQADIEAALRQVGLGAGDVAMVHSSLSSMGHVVGGAETVIEAFLSVLDPSRGTLVLPTLCQAELGDRFETWDIDKSPSDVGLITEVGRLRPDSIRSDNPTHSVAAIGARAVEVTAGHATAHGRPSPWAPTAFGHGSPWEKLYEWNAHTLFLGVTMSVNTIGHFAQAKFVAECLDGAGERREQLEKQLHGWKREGAWPSFDFARAEEWLKQAGLMRYGRIGDALLRATRARDNVDRILHKLRTEPNVLPPDFLNWLQQAGAAG